MSNYNRNLRRFNTGQPDYSTGFNAVQTGMRLMAGNEGGLFGQFGIGPGQYEVKSGDTFSEIAKSQNIGIGELMRLNPDIKDYNVINPGDALNLGGEQQAEGLLGSAQTIGKGIGALDKALGGYGKKAIGALAETGVGEFVKGKVGEIAGSSLVKGLGTAAGALGPIAGAYMAVKGIDKAADATIEEYEKLESGIEAGGVMQVDLGSKFTEARNRLKDVSKKMKTMFSERKGNLVDRYGANAEQVINQGEVVAARTGLETSDTSQAEVTKAEDRIISSYINDSSLLDKQMSAITAQNNQNYANAKTGLIAQGNELQASIDEMKQKKEDMDTSYKLAKGWNTATQFGAKNLFG